ncbi:glycyl-radical enzyme activating protein [Christensenella timonensis]|uniref:glycyl-radical enzyme activating protein n=1 Tax=Christensenella timonensis TaxID=1816678 RepID=UPI000A8BABDE|nr:glycyl-radical enzyme activating protein [Christensenella timonensis]
MDKGYVASIKRFMRGDGPGIRTVVFLKGCNLRCMWCSSPQTWKMKPQVVFLQNKCIGCGRCARVCADAAIRFGPEVHRIDYGACSGCGKCTEVCAPCALRFDGQEMSVEEVLHEVEKDRPYYAKTGGGVTLSGGEATLQAEFAARILKACKERGIHTALETCGQVEWKKMEYVLRFTDILFFDLKHMDAPEHKKLTGHTNKMILENIKRAARKSGCEIVVNLPLIPGKNNTQENLAMLADFMLGLGIEKIRVLPFHRLGEHEYEELGMAYPARKLKMLTKEETSEARDCLKRKGLVIINE